ncbi:MAG: CopG family transcriptional regulator [Candidatus Heimdallarchaeota archaeon]|nr:CopG family transcriptional regulator [Candidatus Heimdallarchaeota archaeon]HUU79707.1 ribbon-helix-helix domain-containing protein [candidate division Zixibacteria bacterium]
MRTISLGIPDLLLNEIDELIEENKIYENRSDVLRKAIFDLLSKELEYYKLKSTNDK